MSLAHTDWDYVLVGGGLQNGLIAACVLRSNPNARVLVVERERELAGNHTWCFHAGDLSDELEAVVGDWVEARFSGYDVAFPDRNRRLENGYTMITSRRMRESLEAQLRAATGARLLTGVEVARVTDNRVFTAQGHEIGARIVVDARGPERLCVACGYQKFLGLEVELSAESPFHAPRLMDACVPQVDGFRFVYCLPVSRRRVLIEDTYYSDSAELNREALRVRIGEYAARHGLNIARVVREESGVLPIPLRAMPDANIRECEYGVSLVGGYQGGWFHPTTGYSLPVAARLAEYFMHRAPSEVNTQELRALQREVRGQARYAIWLNRMLFGAFKPEQRFRALERFYGLPLETIQRFYALRMTGTDKLRMVCGRPPRGISPLQFVHHARREAALQREAVLRREAALQREAVL
jgi:lycopene beta-cyclase